MATDYDNTNSGALFRNDKDGGNPNWPDYRGSVNVEGKEFWLDAWIRESKKDGRKFMSLRLKPKMARAHGAPKNPPVPQADHDFDDPIPF
jgi:hypothetical protein